MADKVTIETHEGLTMASVMARKGVSAEHLAPVLGFCPPSGPSLVLHGADGMLGVGAGSWLAIREGGEGDFAERLGEKLAGLASVSDQSSAYRVWRLAGEGARTLLQRGAALDFHPDSFGPGTVAVTQIAHIGVIIWRPDGRPDYFIACFRSLADSFVHWLEETQRTL